MRREVTWPPNLDSHPPGPGWMPLPSSAQLPGTEPHPGPFFPIGWGRGRPSFLLQLTLRVWTYLPACGCQNHHCGPADALFTLRCPQELTALQVECGGRSALVEVTGHVLAPRSSWPGGWWAERQCGLWEMSVTPVVTLWSWGHALRVQEMLRVSDPQLLTQGSRSRYQAVDAVRGYQGHRKGGDTPHPADKAARHPLR